MTIIVENNSCIKNIITKKKYSCPSHVDRHVHMNTNIVVVTVFAHTCKKMWPMLSHSKLFEIRGALKA